MPPPDLFNAPVLRYFHKYYNSLIFRSETSDNGSALDKRRQSPYFKKNYILYAWSSLLISWQYS
jgi:hypothetical protein